MRGSAQWDGGDQVVAFCERVGAELRRRATELTAEWAQRTTERLGIDTEPFLDPAEPWIVRGMASYLSFGAAGPTSTLQLADRARRLGEIAADQGVLPGQILDAYLLLNALIWRIVDEVVRDTGSELAPQALLPCLHRLLDLLFVMVRSTTGAYFDRYQAQIRKDADRLRGFNRMVSHELKGPIGAIQGAATLLGEDAILRDAAKRRHYQEIVLRNAARMADMINDLLALTMVDRPGGASPPEPVGLAAAMETVRERVDDDARAYDVEVVIDVPAVKLAVDRRALELVLTNLVRNGIRYSDSSKEERWVRITARPEEGDTWTVTVEDNGVGIPAEVGSRIFERFYRASPDLPGSGLGLAIVKELVERWGGRVWYESREGVGSSFHFTAPAAEA
ncbi:MAG: HAMP domain-containing sensor histidine kinase [Gemmatimonadota bacterium]|jgi:signal transduction histidine kinase